MHNAKILVSFVNNVYFPKPQTKFAKVVFLHLSVSNSVHRGCLGPHPGGRLGGSGQGEGCPGPHLGVRVCGGVQAQDRGGSRPRPGGGGIPACTEADTPSRLLLLRAARIILQCILVGLQF